MSTVLEENKLALNETESRESKDSRQALANDAFSGAVEVAGDGREIALSKLSAGDHLVRMKDGREFQIHIPPLADARSLPVMFVISGSAQPQWDIKDFAKESGMNQLADDAKHSFVAVYPLPLKHFLGKYSKQPAFAWNAEGSLINNEDLKFAGYDDMKFVKSVADLLPKIANVDETHKKWGAIAWSQGGPFLNALVSKEENLFPSIGLVGSTMATNFKYDLKPGNAQNVAVIQLLGDKITLPISGSWKYRRQEALAEVLRAAGRNDLVEKASPLAAINNFNQNPLLQEKFYAAHLFPKGTAHAESHWNLASPVKAHSKDNVKEYRGTTYGGDPLRLTVFNLAEAKHSYPGPLRGARTNAQEKYTEFDASAEFVKLFNSYNDSINAARKP